jgi:glucoamylase
VPGKHLHLGSATGSATPLLWAHSEYLKLQRSAADGKVFDLVEPVFERYAGGTAERQPIEVWKFNRQVPRLVAGTRLRIQADAPFLLHWTEDGWQHATDARSVATAVGIEFVDLQPSDRTHSFASRSCGWRTTEGKERTT